MTNYLMVETLVQAGASLVRILATISGLSLLSLEIFASISSVDLPQVSFPLFPRYMGIHKDVAMKIE